MTKTPCQQYAGLSHAQLEEVRANDELALTPEAWFEDERISRTYPEGQRRHLAIKACFDCPVRLECLWDAGLSDVTLEFGIFGGYLASQRRKIAAEMDRRGTPRNNR